MAARVESPLSLKEAPEGGERSLSARAHRDLKKPEAKAEPQNLFDFLKLLSVRRVLENKQLPSLQTPDDPAKVLTRLSEQLGSPKADDRRRAEADIRKILQTADEAADIRGRGIEQFNNAGELGLQDLARTFTGDRNRRGQQATPAVSEARALEGDLFRFLHADQTTAASATEFPEVRQLLAGTLRPEDIDPARLLEIQNRSRELYERVESLVGDRLHMPENHPGLLAISSRLSQLSARAEILRERGMESDATTSVIENVIEHHTSNDPNRLLQVREDRTGHTRTEDQTSLDTFRATVAEDFDPENPQIGNRTNEEVLERLQATASWRSGIRVLSGNNPELVDEIDNVLLMTEESYIEELGDRMVRELKLAENDPLQGAVTDLLRRSINEKRGGRATGKGSFETDVLNWDELAKDVNVKYLAAQKELQRRMMERGGRRRTSQLAELEAMAGIETPMDMIYNERDRVAVLQNAEGFLDSVGLGQFSVDSLLDDTQDAQRDAAMRSHWAAQGLSPLEIDRKVNSANEALNALKGTVRGMRGGLEFGKLELLLKEGDYQQYVHDLKAYFERVGPRESSSDFELSMIVRRAQEVLSRGQVFEGELNQNWQLFQEQLFTRGNFFEIDTKGYGQIAPHLLKQDMLYQLSPEQQWMNGFRVNVRTFNPDANNGQGAWEDQGETKILSTYSYFQMLQREAYADMTMSSEVNATDSLHQRIMLCNLYGDGTHLSADKTQVLDLNNRVICNYEDATKFEFFDAHGATTTAVEGRSLQQIMGEALYISRQAEATWYYSLQWRKFNIDFNLDRYRRINKNILKLSSLEAYDGNYGPGEAALRELCKWGAMLPDYFAYKLGDVENAAVAQWLVQEGVDYEQANWVAKTLGENLTHWAHIKDSKFRMGMLSVEDARLIGRRDEITMGDAWQEFRRRESIKAKARDLTGLETYDDLVTQAGSTDKRVRERAEFYLKTLTNFRKGIANRQLSGKTWGMLDGSRDIITSDGKNLGRLDARTIAILNKRLAKTKDLSGTRAPADTAGWDWFFKNFEYGAIMDYKGQKKQSDVADYMGYFGDSEAVYGLMQKYIMADAEWKTLEEIATTMNKYQPTGEKMEVEKWVKLALNTENKLRTNQLKSYEVPDEDENYLTKYETWVDPQTNKKWYVLDSEGFRVAKKKKVRGNYLLKKRGLQPYTRADKEIRLRRLWGKRILSKGGYNEMMDKELGKRWRRWLERALWFDEPLWAFWMLGEELKKFVAEQGKEIAATATK